MVNRTGSQESATNLGLVTERGDTVAKQELKESVKCVKPQST